MYIFKRVVLTGSSDGPRKYEERVVYCTFLFFKYRFLKFSNKFFASSQFSMKSNDLATSVQAFFTASLSLYPFLDLSYSTGKFRTVSDNFSSSTSDKLLQAILLHVSLSGSNSVIQIRKSV